MKTRSLSPSRLNGLELPLLGTAYWLACNVLLMLTGVKSVSTARRQLFKELIWLQELELQQCGLQEIDTEICGLSQLQKLDVSSNNISEVKDLDASTSCFKISRNHRSFMLPIELSVRCLDFALCEGKISFPEVDFRFWQQPSEP